MVLDKTKSSCVGAPLHPQRATWEQPQPSRRDAGVSQGGAQNLLASQTCEAPHDGVLGTTAQAAAARVTSVLPYGLTLTRQALAPDTVTSMSNGQLALSSDNVGLEILDIEAVFFERDNGEALAIARRELQAVVREIVAEVRKPKHAGKSLPQKVQVAYDALWRRYHAKKRNEAGQPFLLQGLQPQDHRLDCDTSCFVILAAAHELARDDAQWQSVQLATVSGHAWLRVEGLNIDYGDMYDDAHYIEEFHLPADYFATVSAASPIAEAWTVRSHKLFEQRHTEAALAAAKEAVRIDPNMAIAHGMLGDALIGLNRIDEGIEAWKHAWHKGFDTAAILSALEGVIKEHPENANAHDVRGCVLSALGKHREAVAAFEQALRLSSNNPEIRAHLNHASANCDRR